MIFLRGNDTSLQDTKDTLDDCRALAERAVSFAQAVCRQINGGDGETRTKEHVTALLQSVFESLRFLAKLSVPSLWTQGIARD